MTDIAIDQSTFERLQRHAKPFVDTPDSVLNRALDALETLENGPRTGDVGRTETERRIDPRRLPNMTHTKILDASIEGQVLAKANWNFLLVDILVRAMDRLSNFQKLRQLCPVNMVQGRKEDEGYSYLSTIDISVQGQDANSACRTIVAAAKGLGIALEIGFMWRPKEGAAHPGERARLTVASSSKGTSGTKTA